MRPNVSPLALFALAACATASPQQAGVPARAVAPNGGGALLVAEAKAALDRRDSEAAVRLSELAVAANPSAPLARVTLARSYVAAGRFDAAVSAWNDVIAVAPANEAAHLGRSLALLASGQTSSAVAMLARLDPNDDVGLALALASDPRGIAVLSTAARSPHATGRTRQNLALAYAIAGEWTQARAVAATDVPASAIPARLAHWSKIATARPSQRVAILLGVQAAPVDFGRPPVLAPKRAAPPQPAQPKPMTVAFQTAQRASGWVVQLGAYASAKERQSALAALATVDAVKAHAPLLDTKAAWLRLSLTGFPDKLQAQRLCIRLKQAGTACFVRLDAPSA